jgi:SAM-dependent methyltransferase
MREDARVNRGYWDRHADEYQAEHASQLNEQELAWGLWAVPESELNVLGPIDGTDILELGCGGGQWSIFLARRGAKPTGLDNSRQQLLHAKRLMNEKHASFPVVNASAERLPFADSSFDIVFCDHGAMSFADPERTIPEAARVLRPGGLFAFNMSSPLLFACWNEFKDVIEPSLHRVYFDLRRFEYEEDFVEYQLPYGAWIDLFRRHGLIVEDLIELQPPPDATTTYPELVPLEWARRWPAENIWKARKPLAG